MNYLSKKLDVASSSYSVSQVVGEVERAEYYDSSNDCFKCNEGNDIQYYHNSQLANDFKVSNTGVHDPSVTKAMCESYATRQGYAFTEVTNRDTAFGCIEKKEVSTRSWEEYTQAAGGYVTRYETFDTYSVLFVTPETILTNNTYATQTIRQDECQLISSDKWMGTVSSWADQSGALRMEQEIIFQYRHNIALCGVTGITDKNSGAPDLSVDSLTCEQFALKHGKSFAIADETGNPKGCFRQGNSVYYNTNAASTASCGAHGVSICLEEKLSDKCVELYETKCIVTGETVTYELTRDSGQSQSAKDSMTEADCKAYSEQLEQKSYINLVQYGSGPGLGCVITAGYQRYLYYGDNTYMEVTWSGSGEKCLLQW